MTIQFPRRYRDENGVWVPDMPPVDERERLTKRLESCRETLTAKWPHGAHLYTEKTRAQAAERIEVITKQLEALEASN